LAAGGIVTARANSADRIDTVALMDAVQIDWHTTPLREAKFMQEYGPAVSRVLAYGAKGYLFYRSEDDSGHFVHISLWENRDDFTRYWFSREMQEVRKNIAGWHDQPVLPHWNVVVDRN
jgi:quinol monooxygenase YgiN